MKLTIRLGDAEHQLEVARREDRVRIQVDGAEPVELRVVHTDGPWVVLQHGDRLLRAAVQRQGNRRQLWFDGRRAAYERVEAGSRRTTAEHDALSSTIPAVVTQVLVQVGDQVETGDKLILLESMKMVIPIQAPHAGRVSALHCAPGDAVQPGAPLVELDA